MYFDPIEHPKLVQGNWQRHSEQTTEYNCIAYAADDMESWWWPDDAEEYFWPNGVPRERTMAAFESAFALLGYERCKDAKLKRNVEKIAIFADAQGLPTHAARQASNGIWLSKMGSDIDITHDLDAVGGGIYGEVALFMQRPRRV